MSTSSKENRVMKTVFCLKSGKSIVSKLFEKECFKIYNQWAKQKESVKDSESDRIVIEKKRDNKLVEVTAILISEIVSIQITEDTL